jgi:transposase
VEAEKTTGKRQQTKYNAAFRAEAVRRVTQDGQATTRVAQALGMSEAMLGKWVRAARAQAARPAGSEVLEQESKHLRAQLARAEMKRDILKKHCPATCFKRRLSQPTGQLNASHSIPCIPPVGLCQLLGLSPSGYYAWRMRIPVAGPALAAW